jgi:hypothetical protein
MKIAQKSNFFSKKIVNISCMEYLVWETAILDFRWSVCRESQI